MKKNIAISLTMALACFLALLVSCAPQDPEAQREAPRTSAEPASEGAKPLDDRVLPREPEAAPSVPAVPRLLKTRLENAIEQVKSRDLYTDSAFWTVFHGILGLGPDLAILDRRSGKRVNALDYVFSGDNRLGQIQGMRFIPTRHGLDVQVGPTFIGQGHMDQFIGEIAQWGVPVDRKVVVHGLEYTLKDFVNEIKAHCYPHAVPRQEWSWNIVVLAQYEGTKISWQNSRGETIHFTDLVRSELDANVHEQACGGTHLLFGLTWAYHKHRATGGKVEGIWKEVQDYLNLHRDLARKYQNPDGSFSSNYFRGPGATTNAKDRLGSSGHTLEWLAESMSDEELRQQWVQDAANAVSLMILDLQGAEMESGALYHAAHGLVIYYRRMFGWDHFRKQRRADDNGHGPQVSQEKNHVVR